MTAPHVAVAIPAWDAERFVADAIRSALDQTVPPKAVVVVDDGSTDATARIAGGIDERVRVISCPHRGIGVSRNAALAAIAEGPAPDFVAFLDADDLWLPRKLERQLDAFAREPQLDAVFCLVDEFEDFGDQPVVATRAPRTGQPAIISSAVLVRSALLGRVGPFPSGAVVDWVDWWARARGLGAREHVVGEVLLRRRIHGRNNSALRSDGGRMFLGAARQHLRARRAQSEPGRRP